MTTRRADRWRHSILRILWRHLLVVQLAGWFVCPRPVAAQSENASPQWPPPLQTISYAQMGIVKSDGRPISGATIRAVHRDLVLTTITDENGNFVLSGVTPGVWRMSATMFGFETAQQDVQIRDRSISVEFTLQLQPAGYSLPNHPTVEALPRIECPGNAASYTSPATRADNGDEPLLVNGSLSKRLKNDLGSTTRSHERAQDRGTGEIIGNRAKPKDADGIHWGYFYDPRSSILDAAPYSLNGRKNAKPAGFQNLFGLNVGVPMKGPKQLHVDKILWFASYTANLQRIGSNLTTTVPTLAERSGDFSEAGRVINDPTTGVPFPNNRIPTSRINSIARGLMQYVPKPNQPGSVQNFLYTTSTPHTSQSLSTNSILSLSHGDQIAVALNWNRGTGRTAQLFGFTDKITGHGVGANVDWRRAFGPRTSNTFALSLNRNTNSTIPHFAEGPDVALQLGIQGASRNPKNYGPPNLNFTNFGALTDGVYSESATYSAGVTDVLSFNSGEHSWSFGGGYSRLFNDIAGDSNGRGTFTFTGSSTGFDFADFLLAFPNSGSISFGNTATYFRSSRYFIFAQDDYHLRSNMTLNIGLRYEFFSPWQEKYGRMSNLTHGPNFTAVAIVTPATPGQPAGLIKPDRNNFAPRAALAWKPAAKSKMTVRLGYAWFYDPGVYNQFRARLAAQPPFAVSSIVNTSVDHILTLATGLTAMATTTGAGNTFAVRQNYRNMYTQTWSVSVQSDLPAALTGELAYLGTKGTRLDFQGVPTEGLGAVASNFVYVAPDANSIYHAGQARLTRRFHSGVSGNVLYTYAKSIDDSSTLGGPGNSIAQNFYNRRVERGVSSFDRRHSLTADCVWTPPFVDGSDRLPDGRWISWLLKAWTVSGNIMLASGNPLTAQVIGSQFDPTGTGTVSTSRASATGLPVKSATSFFNLQAFGIPPPGQFGNAGRNTIPGPGLFAMNLSLQRTIRIGEGKQLQIRLDSTNVTNHVNLVSVGTVVNTLTYGIPSAAGGMRTVTSHLGFRF